LPKTGVPRLDHISLPVKDWRASRDWRRDKLGFEVEFEIEDAGVAAMRDDADLTVFFGQADDVTVSPGLALAIRVDDVDAKSAELAGSGVAFEHPPQKVFWGYGAELLDPDGYRLRLWDEETMKTKGGG
jgi:catechol 2,3-dioxygenase-like lactoylglutathione lyase family enzyme